LSRKCLVRETSVRESDCPGNVRYPIWATCFGDSRAMVYRVRVSVRLVWSGLWLWFVAIIFVMQMVRCPDIWQPWRSRTRMCCVWSPRARPMMFQKL